MGKLKTFEIRLDHPKAVYYSGQTISGNVHVVVTEPMETRGVHLKINGHGKVRWSERRRRNNKTVTVYYSASEAYFKFSTNLLGDISGNARHTLQPGEYNLPFNFVLPMDLPSSIEARYGHIRYYCDAKIDLPWKFDPKCKVPVTVNTVLDLNRTPSASETVCEDGHKTLCCWCCKSGPISAVVRLHRRGYVPGESIAISAEVTNRSTTRISCTRAVLRALTTYSTGSRTKRDIAKIVEARRSAIPPRQRDVWNGVKLLIPSVPPSLLGNTKIIDVTYFIEFEVEISGAHKNLSIKVPLVIGTVPLRAFFSNYAQQPPDHIPPPSYTDAVLMPVPSAPFLPDYPDLPPPSYMQAAFAEHDEHEEEDYDGKLDRPYKPTYPYYKPKLGGV